MNPEPKTLDDLFERAQHWADWTLRDFGTMRPTILLIADTGQMAMVVYGSAMEDEADKNDLVQVARMLCVAYAATAVVLATESWVMTRSPDERRANRDEMPSEAMDRKEVIMLVGETRATQRMKSLPIIRHDNGTFFNLGESMHPETGVLSGRFANLLTKQVPPPDMRTLAEMFLQLKGLKIVRDFGKPKQ